jgi:hypothetical protein
VFDGMFDAGAKLAVLRTRAIEQHIVQYMRAFAQAGYHIVHSTPIYGAEAEFGWTSVDFRVVSRTDVSVTNVTHKHEAPVIVVVGMMRERPLPAVTTIEWHEGLVIRSKKISYGTVTLASKSFLQRAILDRLVLINAKTTIVPRFPRADEEEWKVSGLTRFLAHMILNSISGVLVFVGRTHSPCVAHVPSTWTVIAHSTYRRQDRGLQVEASCGIERSYQQCAGVRLAPQGCLDVRAPRHSRGARFVQRRVRDDQPPPPPDQLPVGPATAISRMEG